MRMLLWVKPLGPDLLECYGAGHVPVTLFADGRASVAALEPALEFYTKLFSPQPPDARIGSSHLPINGTIGTGRQVDPRHAIRECDELAREKLTQLTLRQYSCRFPGISR